MTNLRAVDIAYLAEHVSVHDRSWACKSFARLCLAIFSLDDDAEVERAILMVNPAIKVGSYNHAHNAIKDACDEVNKHRKMLDLVVPK